VRKTFPGESQSIATARRNPNLGELIKLQDDIHQLLSDLSGRISGEFYDPANQWIPNIDLSENDERIIVKVELPGVQSSDIEVLLQESYLQIRGEKRKIVHPGQVRYFCLERSYGRFCRTICLAVAIDANAATGKLQQGVLTLSLPKLSNRRKPEKFIPIEIS
jgi:HSP20 family protein